MPELRPPDLPPGNLRDLVMALHELHARAGWPSMRDLARHQEFSHTAVHDLFTKTARRPPRLPVLHRVVEQLVELAPRTDSESTLEFFDELWRAAAVVPFGVSPRVNEDASAQARAAFPGNMTHQDEEGDHVQRPGRAMTRELFFLAGHPAPLHDAAAELRRAGYLVRDQPRDLDGAWSLMAYSAASTLSEQDFATLDSIAKRCGVDFDGTGTYVGSPHLDDGPGKPPQQDKPDQVRENFFPPEPDNLFAALAATSPAERRAVKNIATSFMQTLIRMSLDERKLVAHVFEESCRTQLPDNVHISLDIVRRDLGIAPTEVVERLRAMTSLGFEQEIRPDEEHGDDVIVIRWVDTMVYNEEFDTDFSDENATAVAVTMLDVGSGDDGCRQCAENCVADLDFSLLASAPSKP